MNMLDQSKASIGINLRYDIQPLDLHEVLNAKTIFIGAFAHYSAYADMTENEIICYALSEVWHPAKQYYAQHPDEQLYKGHDQIITITIAIIALAVSYAGIGLYANLNRTEKNSK